MHGVIFLFFDWYDIYYEQFTVLYHRKMLSDCIWVAID